MPINLFAHRLPHPRVRRVSAVAFAALCFAGAHMAGCGETAPKQTVTIPIAKDNVPAQYSGLVGSEVEFRNTQQILVSGYGLVVGLAGTGGLPLNDEVAASMERQMGLNGIGVANGSLKGTAFDGKGPAAILRDRSVAVVEVLGAVSPGAPEGYQFDVVVRAVNATSLEGGRLWTTDLRIGAPTTFGKAQSRRLAVARGDVFTNPFGPADAAASGFAGASGRVLGGGEVVDSLNVVMQLVNPSHARARSIVSAINSRFPPGPGDRGPIARGRSDTNIEVDVPTRLRTHAREFLATVQALQIDQTAPEQYARRYVETIKSEPELAEKMGWALEGLGERSLPFVRELYAYPELVPQFTGLKAGARLNDARSAQYLKELALRAQGNVRTEAIELLGLVDAGPSVDQALRDLLKENDLVVRIAAYEALAGRAERAQLAYLVRLQQRNRDSGNPSYTPLQLEAFARNSLPPGLLQGIERRAIEGKFLLDRVTGGVPLMYAALSGTPRLAVFGDDDALRLRGVVSLWDGRFMMVASDSGGDLRVRYQPFGGQPVIANVRPTLSELIALLARDPSPSDPRPAFGMNYAQVVAVLSKVQEVGATTHAFATERDKLQGELIAAESDRDMLDRPETANDTSAVIIRRGSNEGPAATPAGSDEPTIVPITPIKK